MKYLAVITTFLVSAALAAPGPGCPAPSPACPTVTTTATVCKSCSVKACLILSTITPSCGPVPTVTTAYPCSETKCPEGCASTSYIFATPTTGQPPRSSTTLPSTTITPTPSVSSKDPKACTPTVTVTTFGGKVGGCNFDCGSEFCIKDDILTLPCGCTRAASIVTKTATVCPTQSPCYNCQTGFMFTTTATNC